MSITICTYIYKIIVYLKKYTLISFKSIQLVCSKQIFNLFFSRFTELHCIDCRSFTVQWFLAQDCTYLSGLNSEIGGPLRLIIIKCETFETRSTYLLLVKMLFIRLKPISHFAVLAGKVFIEFLKGLKFWL